MRKTAVVTGGAGFLGAYLCERLLELDFEVICLDNLITGSMQNIAHLSDNRDFIFIKHDVTKHIALKEGFPHSPFCLAGKPG